MTTRTQPITPVVTDSVRINLLTGSRGHGSDRARCDADAQPGGGARFGFLAGPMASS